MQSLPIINKTYETYKDIVEMNHKLTKRWHYSLGLSLENSVLDLMENLIMAKNAPKPLKAGSDQSKRQTGSRNPQIATSP